MTRNGKSQFQAVQISAGTGTAGRGAFAVFQARWYQCNVPMHDRPVSENHDLITLHKNVPAINLFWLWRVACRQFKNIWMRKV